VSADGSVKDETAFRTISEASDELEVPQHVLRFWEQKFGAIRPMKRAGGRRYYRPQDLDLLHGVKSLLYKDGYTIKGAQQLFKDRGQKFVQDLGRRARSGDAASALDVAEENAHEEDAAAEAAAPAAGGPDAAALDALRRVRARLAAVREAVADAAALLADDRAG